VKILITGSTGQIGHELARLALPLGTILLPARDELDMRSADSISSFLRTHTPDLVLNAAAYTAVDKAEDEVELARAVNATAIGVIALECRRFGAPVIHYSTDYVFDGGSEVPYVESDPTCPLGVYGQTKLEGEQLLATSGTPHLILRTSWVYGQRGTNFLRTIRRADAQGRNLRIVADQIGTPNWSRVLAQATILAVASSPGGPRTGRAGLAEFLTQFGGIYHLACKGQCSWYEFASAFVPDAVNRITPIATNEYPTRARRPLHSVLNASHFESVFGLTMPGWREALSLCLRDPD
jgi:dTDP-4-dehydrorhamnose reductase